MIMLQRLLLVVLVLLLTGCGFQLRGQNVLPPALYHMTLQNSGSYDPLIRRLSQELLLLGVQNDPRNRTQLIIEEHHITERIVTIHSTNQVRVYAYDYTLNYSLKVGRNYLIKNKLIVADRQLVLAPGARTETNDQKELLIKDLERAVVEQLLNQLRAIPSMRPCP